MRKVFLFFIGISLFPLAIHAQDYHWKIGADYFFDNTEYGKSSYIDSQTMNGIWLNPSGEISWGARHAIRAGVNLLKIPGTEETVDKVDLTVYYQYQTPKVLFKAGAFPREEVLPNYSDFFFKDSVTHFLPLMRGVFWQFGREKSFFNMWMDWTSYATETSREKFFVGFSGKVAKKLFFADFQSYMFHNANTRPATEGEGVHENMQLQASLGLCHTDEAGFKGLLSIGVLAGYERDRFRDERYSPVGFTSRLNAEYKGIGTENTLYAGDARMRMFDRFGGDLYWGTPFLQSKSYVESKWYVRLLESARATARLNCNLHFSEGHVLFQQTLSVSVSIDNFTHPERENNPFPWTKIFQ